MVPLITPVTLQPRYGVPLGVAVLAGLAVSWLPWVGVGLGLFAGFLAYQAATVRLTFTATALAVSRSTKVFVSFPYQDWLAWTIFWPGCPVLFYFREVKNIHLIPMLFDRTQLQACLVNFVGEKD
ncbi:DUF3119 family protein [Candidatus Cyanaurora vandensis]|uniref:DUF3119 family protein n=1 Tax=Candidatus Cyanaurora vandensis TaxID=2714958 RepID=UPI00257AEB1A|nr:DUF3119 family protein [Candidatus Cyanaurora vandensis]